MIRVPETSRQVDVEGSDAVSRVLLDLLNQYPGLSGKSILFSTLSEKSGIGFFPTSGAVLIDNRTDITGHVKQVCAYPFNVIYRAAARSEAQKLSIKELLDGLGKWLELQTVIIDSTPYKLGGYPDLVSGNRKITGITRTTPAYLYAAYDNGVEDWVISLSLRYNNEFTK